MNDTKQPAYQAVAAVSVSLHDGVPVTYDTTAPDFLCMSHDEAQHALTHGHAATVTPDVWAALRQGLERAGAVRTEVVR